MAGRLELISGWARSNTFVRAALSQVVAASKEEKHVATQAMAARDATLKDALVVQKSCKALENGLQGMRDKLAKEVGDRQAKEEEMKAQEAAIRDHDTELSADRSRLKTLSRS